MTVLAYDTFNRANGSLVGSTSDSGHTWLDHGFYGDFAISSNTVSQTGGSSANMVDLGATDCEMTIENVGGTTWAQIGFVIRYVNDSNFALVYLDNSQDRVEMDPRESGSWGTSINGAASSYTGTNPGTLKVSVAGFTVRFWVDGVLLFTAPLPAGLASGTKFGIFAAGSPGATFDNFNTTDGAVALSGWSVGSVPILG